MAARKPQVTVKKFEGDDACSWAVFIDGRPAFTGLSRNQASYYRRQAEQGYRDASVARLDQVGYYS